MPESSQKLFFQPAFFRALRGYSVESFRHDSIAGITVGLVALPLAMAFAIASGLSPQAGLYTAVVAGFLISALGGSATQIGGPTGAFVVIVYGIVAKYDVGGLFLCTIMAGIILLVLGASGLGSAVRFIPRPVVVGFTNGIAVLIASTQVKDFFGLKVSKVPADFIGRIEVLAKNFNTLSVAETILGLSSLCIILICARYVKRVPGYIVALAFGTAVVYALEQVNGGGAQGTTQILETIGTRFGGIPRGLPHLAIPQMNFHLMVPLIPSAITVAMLGAIESLLSAVVADRMTREKHDPNQELLAQGIANMFSPLFGGLPATGAIARTATNIRAGARTPVSGIIHSLTLVLVLLVAAPMAKYIPLAALAAILFVVSYNMGEWHEIPQLLKLGKADIATWIVTFALTVFADLTVAVECGMILAALLFIRSVAETTSVSEITVEDIAQGESHVLQGKDVPPFVSMFRIHGPFLFGTTDKLDVISHQLAELQPVVILRLRNMTALDATGLHAIESLAGSVRASGRAFIVCGSREQPAELLHQAGFERSVGKENICETVTHALTQAHAAYPSVEHIHPQARPHRRRTD